MILKADLHTHTNASPDGRSSLAALCAAAQKKGIGALAVCDHNRFTAVPESLCGVLLIPGCEFSTQAGHITGLFLERQPDFARLFARGLPGGAETVAEIRRCGGLAILAHPFQNPRRSVNDFLFPLDGVETRNARAGLKNKPANLQAEMFAQEKGLPSIGASDAHAAQATPIPKSNAAPRYCRRCAQRWRREGEGLSCKKTPAIPVKGSHNFARCGGQAG